MSAAVPSTLRDLLSFGILPGGDIVLLISKVIICPYLQSYPLILSNIIHDVFISFKERVHAFIKTKSSSFICDDFISMLLLSHLMYSKPKQSVHLNEDKR